jgi:hypothetical protein
MNLLKRLKSNNIPSAPAYHWAAWNVAFATDESFFVWSRGEKTVTILPLNIITRREGEKGKGIAEN